MYLVLTRKSGEEIVIDHPSGAVTLRVIFADRGKARVAVDAPSDVSVHRKEVRERIDAAAFAALLPQS